MNEYPEGVPGEFRGEFRGNSGEFRGVPLFLSYFPLCGALEKRRLEGVPVATTPSVYYHGPLSGNLLAPVLLFLEIYWWKSTATHPTPPWKVRYVATNFLTG